jgi:hypothetical protein
LIDANLSGQWKNQEGRFWGAVAMGKKKSKNIRVELLAVVWCAVVMLPFAAPCGAQGELNLGDDCDYEGAYYVTVLDGTVNLHEGAIVYGLMVYEGGTVNIYPGAYVNWFMWVYGGTVNIYGGGVGYVGIWVFNADPQPAVTVYGTYFEVYDGEQTTYGATDQFIPKPGVGSVLTGFYENEDLIDLEFYGPVPIRLVNLTPELAIDIRPGSDTNVVNLKSKGLVPVAVLTTDDFDAATVDPETVLLAGAAPVRWTMDDVDGDGDEDMLLHFKTQELELSEDSTEAKLTAQLIGSSTSQSTDETSNTPTVSGTDEVRILSSKSKK